MDINESSCLHVRDFDVHIKPDKGGGFMPLKYQVPDYKKVRVIVDSDAACEADDPFAIAHALLCDKFIVKAIFAEHFNCEGSTKQSFE